MEIIQNQLTDKLISSERNRYLVRLFHGKIRLEKGNKKYFSVA